MRDLSEGGVALTCLQPLGDKNENHKNIQIRGVPVLESLPFHLLSNFVVRSLYLEMVPLFLLVSSYFMNMQSCGIFVRPSDGPRLPVRESKEHGFYQEAKESVS